MLHYKRKYLDDNFTELYLALKNTYLLDPLRSIYSISIDIDWRNIVEVLSYATLEALDPEGSSDTVYVIGESSPYELYIWDGTEYVKTKNTVSDPSFVTTTTAPATITITSTYSADACFEIYTKALSSTKCGVGWNVYATDGVHNFFGGTTTNPVVFNYLYSCTNGIILSLTIKNPAVIRIVMSESTHDKNEALLTFITPTVLTSSVINTTDDGHATDLQCISEGDVAPFQTFSIPVKSDTHYQVVPMLTNAPSDRAYYTAKSGFLSNAPSAAKGVKKCVLINGIVYLTDGYFAIEDGAIDD